MGINHVLPGKSYKTILLVDDDRHIVTLLVDILKRQNYMVLTASSGSEALQLSRQTSAQIDLLLSDFHMPGMTGVALAQAITQDRPGIKVLLMSGFASGLLTLDEGWQFVAKPFVSTHLCALVDRLIATR